MVVCGRWVGYDIIPETSDLNPHNRCLAKGELRHKPLTSIVKIIIISSTYLISVSPLQVAQDAACYQHSPDTALNCRGAGDFEAEKGIFGVKENGRAQTLTVQKKMCYLSRQILPVFFSSLFKESQEH